LFQFARLDPCAEFGQDVGLIDLNIDKSQIAAVHGDHPSDFGSQD